MANVVPMLAGVGLLSVCCISSSLLAGAMGGEKTTEEPASVKTTTPVKETTTYEYGLVNPNLHHVGTPGDNQAKTYDECRSQAKEKGHLAWGMQTTNHPDVSGEYGWCWSVLNLDHFVSLDSTGEGGDKDAHVQGCVDTTKKVSKKCV